MTPRLTRLRIAGFKSFAEPVSLDILPGLTGIVGPNGCGKSNVVEALRWAMGETSARSLRGGEMDDVIFAGTTARAGRNLAEVTVTLTCDDGALPAPFEAEAELQLTRRIERGAGSSFRANGRELRARDVQTLYADLASGARSSGMVSQGRVAALVNARPEERRQVLEEAAGITGLHARRHEAELKLRAAEYNLARSNDLRLQLEATREGLQRQGRQAARYRAISGLIRAAEADHLGILHGQAGAALQRARAEEAAVATESEAACVAEAAADAALAEAEAALPSPRQAVVETGALLERRRLEMETVAADAERAALAYQAASTRLLHLQSDLEDAGRAHADAASSVARLSADLDRQTTRLSCLPEEIILSLARAEKARMAAEAAQTAADAAAQAEAVQQAAARQAGEELAAAAERLATLRDRHPELRAQLDASMLARIEQSRLSDATAEVAASEAALAAARAELEEAAAERELATGSALTARAALERAQAAHQAVDRSEAEITERAGMAKQACDTAASERRRLEAGNTPHAQVLQAQQSAQTADRVLAEAEAQLASAEAAAAQSLEKAALARRCLQDGQARRARAQEAVDAALARAGRLGAEKQAAEAAWAEAERAGPSPDRVGEAEAACHAAEASLQARTAVQERLGAARQHTADTAEQARSGAAFAEAVTARLSAELQGLGAALGDAAHDDGLLATLQVPHGLEAAVGAALGDAALSSLDPASPSSWRSLPPMPRAALPPGCVTLASLMSAPAELARALSHVAVLDEGEDGAAVQPGLAAGVILVNRAGACWRWDGHVRQAGATNPAAARLGLLRRRAGTRADHAQAVQKALQARAAWQAAQAEEATAIRLDETAREAVVLAEADQRRAARLAEHLKAEAALTAARLEALQPLLATLRADHRASERTTQVARDEVAAVPELAGLEGALLAAEHASQSCAGALQAARQDRATARAGAEQARIALQAACSTAERSEMLTQAATAASERADAYLRSTLSALDAVWAARAGLPGLPELQAEMHRAGVMEAACRAREAGARSLRQQAETAVDRARQSAAELRMAHVEAEARYAALSDQLARCAADLAAAERLAGQAADQVARLPDASALAEASSAAKRELDAAREAVAQAGSQAALLQAEQAHAARALDSLQVEVLAWQRRLDEAEARQAGLAARGSEARDACTKLAARPGEFAARAAQSKDGLARAEADHAGATAALDAAEHGVRTRQSAQRDAVRHAAACREGRLRAEAIAEAAAGALQAVLDRTAERLGTGRLLAEAAELSDQAEERARKRFERLSREREEMGPVNLCAEAELEELDGRLAALDLDRGELGTAIAKLRGAIGHLNREGRERLLSVFAEVDEHFRILFTRMMGGGRAHLALTGADDPLAAGLEIYAEPPGKKPAALSLLSGGEQALTALSLIFAVFRCTPAPLCVLDEVDAPLDDANVERFCTLLDDMVRDTGTSFLVVTHHQLTMSRMDRLFGVTMQERGVSRLLSVDLGRAAAMAAPLLEAAE